ncbi:MAG: hypothetical protein MZU95_01470 [Desulfomicrobium escambiense]|nr:hypothetical protein [Desulfomicrobium escambiense]
MARGHLACQGCGATLAMRYMLKALGQQDDPRASRPAAGPSSTARSPTPAMDVPHATHCAFEARRADGDRASRPAWTRLGEHRDHGRGLGRRRRHVRHRPPGPVRRGRAQRGHHLRLLRQRSLHEHRHPALVGAPPTAPGPRRRRSSTSRPGRRRTSTAIMAAHRIPYIATASVAYPEDFVKKLKKAKGITRHASFFHVYRALPDGLEEPPRGHRQAGPDGRPERLLPALRDRERRERTPSTSKLKDKKPVDDYIRLQGRFRHLKPGADRGASRPTVDARWERLLEAGRRLRSGRDLVLQTLGSSALAMKTWSLFLSRP